MTHLLIDQPFKDTSLFSEESPEAVEDAILKTVAYADIFDYPLNAEEIYRYLINQKSTIRQVKSLLFSTKLIPGLLQYERGYYTLVGRSNIIESRKRREEISEQLWPAALYYGQAISLLPYVRLVAITGALAVNNIEKISDIDYLIVTETGRVWLCRAFVILMVRWARFRGVSICPNYFISKNALTFPKQNLYSAHELMHMVPVFGFDIYNRLIENNRWVNRCLPNAIGPSQNRLINQSSSTKFGFKLMMEKVFNNQVVDWLDKREMYRIINKYGTLKNVPTNSSNQEVSFCPQWCKGHFHDHGTQTMSAYEDRLNTLGIFNIDSDK